jgi:alkylated DNA repair dioxygenase AlkB
MHNIEWRNDESLIYGKLITTKRKVAWYADEPFDYTYSNITKQALPWTPALLSLKKVVEEYAAEKFNSCLLNLYHTGDEGMSWHSDGEKMLKKNGAIASMSLGAERKFSFKHKKDQTKIDMLLQHGSLMIMKGETQTHWMHRLPPTRKIKSPRVNLTFRNIVVKNS